MFVLASHSSQPDVALSNHVGHASAGNASTSGIQRAPDFRTEETLGFVGALRNHLWHENQDAVPEPPIQRQGHIKEAAPVLQDEKFSCIRIHKYPSEKKLHTISYASARKTPWAVQDPRLSSMPDEGGKFRPISRTIFL
jgi:hypothetical protein